MKTAATLVEAAVSLPAVAARSVGLGHPGPHRVHPVGFDESV